MGYLLEKILCRKVDLLKSYGRKTKFWWRNVRRVLVFMFSACFEVEKVEIDMDCIY